MPFARLQSFFAAGLCLFLAVALQIQLSFFQAENYEGLRLNLGDLSLPLAGIFILTSLLLKKSQWPRFEKPFHYGWLIALTLIISISFFKGDGGQWALINKFAGWFVVVAYFGMGAWIAVNFPALPEKFLKIFAIVFLISASALPVLAILNLSGIIDLSFYFTRPYKALMGNSNAYGFLACSIGAFATILTLKQSGRRLYFLFWTAAPFLIAFSGSRTLWLVFALMGAFFIFLNWRVALRSMLPALILGSILALPLMQSAPLTKRPIYAMQWLHDYTVAPEEPDSVMRIGYSGDNKRLANIELAVDLWKENPVLGAGLGASHDMQVERHGKLLAVIDNTLLWIAAEMGTAGLVIFLGSYIAMLCALWRKAKEEESYGLAACGIALLLIFGIYSLFHEMLYTRFMWFILGLALARKPD